MRKEIWTKKGDVEYLDVAVSFDIETSSFVKRNGKTISFAEYNSKDFIGKSECTKESLMYIWQMDFNDDIIIGRTWDEFKDKMNEIRNKYDLSLTRRVIIWVHNLGFELEFIKTFFDWDPKQCLCIESYKPCCMVCTEGFEFRCSYIYSGLPLSKIEVNGMHKLNDKEELDLDYNLLRTPETPLTQSELDYCVMDVKLVNAFIESECTIYGNICNFPYTNTGKVRQYAREKCLANENYQEKVKDITLTAHEYKLLKQAYAAGFTHCAPLHVGDVCYDVAHVDFKSSYPAVLVSRKYPMGKGTVVNVENLSNQGFRDLLKKKCCLMRANFVNIRAKEHYDYFISENKCIKKKGVTKFNGRIESAEKIEIALTDVDLQIIKKTYTWDKFQLLELIVYDKDYLPKEFIEVVLDLFYKKECYKGMEGKEAEYALAKSMLNSLYGMCVTDIVKDTVIYDGDYHDVQNDVIAMVARYNASKKRFLAYQWGVWCSAYAREALISNIVAGMKYNYIYADTDSIFFFDNEDSRRYIERYNSYISDLCASVAKARGIDFEKFKPKGTLIGSWTEEDHCKKFKSLGAKRYLEVHEDDSVRLTFAGIRNPRTTGQQYLQKLAAEHNNDIMDAFNEDLDFPWDINIKTVLYRHNEVEGIVIDYLGNEYHYNEVSGLALIPCSYKTDEIDQLLEYCATLKKVISN